MNINFKDKKTWIIIGAIVIVIAVVVILIRRKKKNKEEDEKIETGKATKLPEASWNLKPTTSGYSTENGSYGWQILLIQKALNDLHGCKLTLDGKYGNCTKAAVIANYSNVVGTDGEISASEFSALCEQFIQQYNSDSKLPNYSNVSDLQSLFKSA